MTCNAKYKNRYNQAVLDQIRTHGEKVYIYFATKTLVDEYEGNYTYTNLNPKVIQAYITQISPEALVWRQYGLAEQGAKELLCEEKYKEWFKNATRITIDGDEYECFKDGTGKRALIQERPFKMIRVVLKRKT